MGKFAGFLKRAKNFALNTIPNAIAKGIFAANNLYKKYEPLINTGIHLALEPLGGPIGGAIAGAITDLGLKRASQLADKAEWGYNHPGQFWSNYDNQKAYEGKNVIVIPPKRNNNYDNNNYASSSSNNESRQQMTILNNNEHAKQGLTELARINAK